MAPTRRPDTAAFAAKEREQAGSDIFGAGPAPVAQAADVWSAEAEAPPPAFLEATAENIKAMMHQELRELCRAHGLSPAGAKNTLVERVCEAMVTGQIRVQVANRGVSGVARRVRGAAAQIRPRLGLRVLRDADLSGPRYRRGRGSPKQLRAARSSRIRRTDDKAEVVKCLLVSYRPLASCGASAFLRVLFELRWPL